MLTSANYYNAVKDYASANRSYRDYLDLNKKVTAMENEQMLQNEDVAINIDQKEIENAERENALRKFQLEDANQKSARAYLLFGIIILSGIIIFLVFNNQNAKRREAQLSIKNEQIVSQKHQIEQSLKEKEVLIKEIHHRVKNNLQIITSMLSLQIGKVNDEKTETILRDAKQRISSIALTHQMLYQKEDLSNINLGEYIERLVRQVEFIMPVSNIELITDIDERMGHLTIDTAVPLGLLVNELLTNAYKHAFPEGVQGKIKISLMEEKDAFVLTVSDNGVGLPEDFETTERKTLGIELVYILAEQLDSAITVDKTKGSSFSLKIKKNIS
jgi:two-component sensor histidine kinase